MHIGLVASKPVTIDRFFEEWIHAWVADGHEVHVALEDGEVSASDPTAMIGVKGLRRRPSWTVFKARSELRSWCRDNALDVVVTHAATPSAITRLFISATPIVYFCHGLHWRNASDWPSYAWSGLERVLLKRTDGVVCMNDADESWFRNRYPGPLLRLKAGVGLDLDLWTPRMTHPPLDEVSLLWIGEFTTRKRPEEALAVFRELRESGHAAELVMLGTGPLHAQVRASILPGERVELAGHRNPIPFLQKASALIHTATWEGFTRVLMESVALGVPAFGYATKGVLDVPGVVVRGEPGDPGAIAAIVAEWIDSGGPTLNVRRGDLDWRIAYDEVTEFLERLILQRPGSALSGD